MEISEMRIVAVANLSFSKGEMTEDARARPSDTPPDRSAAPPMTADYFFYLVFQAARQRDLFCDRVLKPLGLNVAQWRSLAIIRRLEACSMTALARYSTVERTTLTRAVDQLVGRGFVVRAVPARDRRQVTLALTEAGEDIYRQAVAILSTGNQAVVGKIPPRRLQDATEVLGVTLERLVGGGQMAEDLLNFGRFALDPEG
jgi:DNA-binding MarR family transcriptional regulator